MQDELDEDCAEYSALAVTFMSWALGAIVTVLFDLIAFLSGDDKISGTIWGVVIDAFLAISEILFVCSFLVMGATLTQRMDAPIIESVKRMRAKNVPISKADGVFNYEVLSPGCIRGNQTPKGPSGAEPALGSLISSSSMPRPTSMAFWTATIEMKRTTGYWCMMSCHCRG